MIGLKRGAVKLCEHEAEWEENAALTIKTDIRRCHCGCCPCWQHFHYEN